MAISRLYFLGQERDLLTVEMDYRKFYYHWNGMPTNFNEGGLIRVTFATHPNDVIFYERMTTINYDLYKRGYPLDKGRVVFYDAIGDVVKKYEYEDAAIVLAKNTFYAEGETSMTTELIISPAIQNYGAKLHRWWHISPIEKETYQTPVYATEQAEKDFDISIKHITEEKTFVPMGIPAFSGNPENKYIHFEVEIRKNDIDEFDIEILHDNKVIKTYYSGKRTLDEVVITAKGSGNSSATSNDQSAPPANYPVGKYSLKWDGFDANGIYDSTLFTSGKLKARVKGRLQGKEKKADSNEFSFEYKEVSWVYTKIDWNTKRIDVTLRVNLRDGGEQGTEKDCYEMGASRNAPIVKSCPWDKVSKEALTHYRKTPIKTRTKTIEQLKQLALDGIDKYWSRHKGNIGKGIEIDGELYEVFVAAIHDDEGMKAPEIIYFTNLENTTFKRSHNWEASRKLFYKIGYTYYGDWKDYPESKDIFNNKGWYYSNESKTIDDFLDTAAHEIGHEILLELGGHRYSKAHKGTSHWSLIIQNPISGTKYPKTGEIDLMKYADDYKPFNYLSRVIAAEEDVLGLIWLTKLEAL